MESDRERDAREEPGQATAPTDDGGSEETERAEDADRPDEERGGEDEEIEAEMKRVEENPPDSLEDWPQGKAKYETYGGPEGTHSYHEGPEQKLGPSSLRHHEGGDVEIEGEMVDDPEKYKGEPIPGGPTDPNAPSQAGERELQTKGKSGDEEPDDSGDQSDGSSE